MARVAVNKTKTVERRTTRGTKTSARRSAKVQEAANSFVSKADLRASISALEEKVKKLQAEKRQLARENRELAAQLPGSSQKTSRTKKTAA